MLTPPLPRVPPPPEALALAPPCWLLSLLGGAKAGRSVPTLGSLGAAPPAATAAAAVALPPPAPPPFAADLARKNAERLLIAWSKSEGVASKRRTQADS